MTNKKGRDSNIELLRILTMLGVVILHYNNPTIGKAFVFTEGIQVSYLILSFFESLCVGAVDVFMIISGYFMCKNSKRNIIKPLELLIQTVIFSEAVYLVGILNGNEITVKGMISHAIPANYFVILYISVYFISPYINRLINRLNEKQLKKMLLLLFIILSVYPTLVDFFSEITHREYMGLSTIGAYGSQWGYTLVNFIFMYIIGAYLRNCSTEYKKGKLLFFLTVDTLVLTVWSFADAKIGYSVERCAWEYCNPLVILSAITVFLLFKQANIGENKFINYIAKASFTVYLINIPLLKMFEIKKYATSNPLALVLHMFVTAICIYAVSTVVYYAYKVVTDCIFNHSLRKIDYLSKDMYGDLLNEE
ncbi:MAG: acyltransferase [Clostridia bacterium]|nr:acyltransferase [Clostridia bacterium]